MCAMAERLGNGGAQRKPKIAKGARDFLPEQVCQYPGYDLANPRAVCGRAVNRAVGDHIIA